MGLARLGMGLGLLRMGLWFRLGLGLGLGIRVGSLGTVLGLAHLLVQPMDLC